MIRPNPGGEYKLTIATADKCRGMRRFRRREHHVRDLQRRRFGSRTTSRSARSPRLRPTPYARGRRRRRSPRPRPRPTPTPEPTPTPQPTPTPNPTQFSVPAFAIECGGSITVTNFAAANVDDVLLSDGTVIDADGTYELEPGDYTAVGRVGGEVVTDEVEFTIEACPTAEPTPTPTPTPDGGVGGATGTPNVTLPPTDTLAAADHRSLR